jgi:hypothetical protein
MNMKAMLLALVALVGFSTSHAQDIVVIPASPTVGDQITAKLDNLPALDPQDKREVKWSYDTKFHKHGDNLLFLSGKSGTHKIVATITTTVPYLKPGPNYEKDKNDVLVKQDVTTNQIVKTFDIVGETPAPTPPTPGPTPPGPNPPGPTPPGPTPEPDKVAPIAEPKLNVMIVEETSDRIHIPWDQIVAMQSTVWRQYVDSKSGLEPSGAHHYRLVDKDDNMAKDAKKWSDAFARPRNTTPWIIVSNGKTGYEGPLPKNLADLMTLIQKYGG